MASAMHAAKHNGIKPEHLSKTWHVDVDAARKTLDLTSQQSVRKDNPMLSHNCGTNDRMLRHKHLKDYFFMDTLFATKKAKASSKGHSCLQLFVTGKGFIYVVPMRKESDVLQAAKQFAKAMGAPDAIICDTSKAQTSQAVKQFYGDMGTTLSLVLVMQNCILV